MRLARFRLDDRVGVGVVNRDTIAEITDMSPARADAVALLANEPSVVADLIGRARNHHPLDDVELLPPVFPRKFFGIGLNYADHVSEAGLERPTVPVFFNKQPTCVIGSGQAIERPLASTQLDYEGELGLVIGRRCRHVTRDLAPQVIAGYLIVNDVSVRDWQVAAPTITLGKSWDTHGPIGPWLTTTDEAGDPHDLDLVTYVNGQVRQRTSTRNMIFDCFDQIAHLSTVCTLEVGDVIATGTSSGVGALMNPPSFLVPGDVVRIEIEGLGALENPVIQEADDLPQIDRDRE